MGQPFSFGKELGIFRSRAKIQETGKNQRIDFSRFFVSRVFGVQNCIFTSKIWHLSHRFPFELGI